MITITDGAAFRIKEMLESASVDRLRFGVVGGGCTGLSYVLGYAEAVDEKDKVWTVNGIDVVMREEEMAIVEGTVIDYKESLMGGGFIIENPNAIASCGCGASFRTKEEAGRPENC